MTWGGRAVMQLRAALARTLPRPCSKCGALVHPWQRWDVDHLIDRHRAPGRTWDPSNLAVAHAHCNRSDGAAKGNRRRARQTTWTAPGW